MNNLFWWGQGFRVTWRDDYPFGDEVNYASTTLTPPSVFPGGRPSDIYANFAGATVLDLTYLASLVVQPLLGCAVIVCALTHRLPAAIVAIALLMLARWGSEVPSIIHHGLGLAGDPLVVLHRLFRTVLQPVIALAAIAAARPNGNLLAAAIAVILPGLLEIAGVAAFLVSLGAPGL